MHILYGKATFPYKICEKNRPTRYGVHRTWITGEVLPQLCTLQKYIVMGGSTPQKNLRIFYMGKRHSHIKYAKKNRPPNLGSPIPSDTGEVPAPPPPPDMYFPKIYSYGGSTPQKNFRIFYMGKATKNGSSHCRRFVAFESRVGRFFRVGLYIWSIYEHFDTLVTGIGNNPKYILYI
jgi:hypothetical protein